MTRPADMTRDQRIALAERTIAGCLGIHSDDQFLPGNERSVTDPAAVTFTVHVVDERRAWHLVRVIGIALTGEHLTPWARVSATADGCRVEFRVPVGAP